MWLYWGPGRARQSVVNLTLCALCCTLALLLANHALAQPAQGASTQETAIARALFKEGVTFADVGDWESAADRFSRAHSLRPSSGIAFNLACAEVEIGRLVSASEHFRGILQDAAATPELKRDAEARLTTLTPRLSYVTLHVEGASEDTELLVDNRPLPRAGWDVATPIDPGSHTIAVTNAARVLSSSALAISEGETRELTLSALPPAAPPPVEPLPIVQAQPDQPPKDEPRRPLYKNPWLWTGVGAAVAGGVVLAFLLTQSESPKEESPVMGNAGPGVISW